MAAASSLWKATSTFQSSRRKVAQIMQQPGAQRDRLFAGVYVPTDPEQASARLDHALGLCTQAQEIQKRIKDAVKAGKLEKGSPAAMVAAAEEAKVISAEDATLLREAEAARTDALTVDSFALEDYVKGTPSTRIELHPVSESN